MRNLSVSLAVSLLIAGCGGGGAILASNEGMSVMHEVETLNEGLTDTVKAIAEELEIKPSILKRAIRVAYKSRLGETNKENEELNTILETVGKTL